jgi:RimJ/RimL family protein N-acetyltransferase
VHGAGDAGWSWHLVAEALQAKGHTVVAPDLPTDDESKDLTDWATTVVDALPSTEDVIVVGHSFGGLVAPLVADRIHAKALILVTAMLPRPGEAPGDWWANTGYADSGLEDQFFHDVPPHLAEESEKHARDMSEASQAKPWPLPAMPSLPTRFILCTEDRFFPPDFMRKVVADRLGTDPIELAAGHCAQLSRPTELAELLHRISKPPMLSTTHIPADRVILRKAREADREGLIELQSDPELWTYLGGPHSREAVAQRLEEIGVAAVTALPGTFVIADKTTDELLGTVELKLRNADLPGHVTEEGGELELGYLLRQSAWGSGLAFEAVTAALRAAADELPDQPVLIVTQTANQRSLKLAARLGFEPVSTFVEFEAEQTLSTADLHAFKG